MKTVEELEADIAEAKAAIARAKLADKRAKALAALDKWRDRYKGLLDQAERDTVIELRNALMPAQLTLGDAKP
jgi:hypothetical protein